MKLRLFTNPVQNCLPVQNVAIKLLIDGMTRDSGYVLRVNLGKSRVNFEWISRIFSLRQEIKIYGMIWRNASPFRAGIRAVTG